MPLEFLRRRGNVEATPAPAVPAPTNQSGLTMPEEVVAQDHQLKLYYAGKSSEGVRMKSGPKALAELPGMLAGLARSEIEVVAPLAIEFSQATPTISRPSEAMQWLNAHHVLSPITRHALVVLESIDAVDLAFDTFACALLDGEHPHQHPGEPVRAGHDPDRATRAGGRTRRPGVRALRVRVCPRASVLLPEMRHAPASRLTPPGPIA